MNSEIDDKAFRTWQIPESIIKGKFPNIPIKPILEIATCNKNNNTNQSTNLSMNKSLSSNIAISKLMENKGSCVVQESTVSRLLDYANLTERRIILKSLFLSDNQILKFSLRQALMPVVENKICKWLKIATSDDKSVVINFFKRMIINQHLSTNDKYFVQHILEIIKNQEEYWLTTKTHPILACDGEKKLKFLNLQTPESRRQRWVYTSWNHMPQYKQVFNPIDLKGSHYYIPNKHLASTYKIHPDIG